VQVLGGQILLMVLFTAKDWSFLLRDEEEENRF